MGGKSRGFFAIKGRLKIVIIIITKWKQEEIKTLLYMFYLSLYGSDINATLVNPDPDNIPMISSTLP